VETGEQKGQKEGAGDGVGGERRKESEGCSPNLGA